MSSARVVVDLQCAMTADDVARVCARVEALLRADVPVRVCVSTADLAVIDALARMQLWAHRLDALLEVIGADDRCADLIGLVGLGDVLQVDRQAEAREERGVEEVVDVGDPSA